MKNYENFIYYTCFLYLQVLIEILKQSPGGRYEMAISHEVCDLCEEISNADGDYQTYLKYFGFPSTCPFDAVIFLFF